MSTPNTLPIHLPFLRTPYNYDRDAVSLATGVHCLDASKTQQQFRDECDINVIVERFGLTGQLPVGARMPSYGDFSGIWDYQTALNAVAEADAMFMAMPAKLRARFENDPQRLLKFVTDERNRAEAIELGLIPKPADAPPSPGKGPSGADPVPAGGTPKP